MSAGAVPGAGGAGSQRAAAEARRDARGFQEHLQRARDEARALRARAQDRRRAGRGAEAASPAHGREPAATRLRRRSDADLDRAGLEQRRRELDGGERSDGDRRAGAPAGPARPACGSPADLPTGARPIPADLAAAVEKLAVTLERRERSLGPALRMDLGGRLSVRLARAARGIEIVFAAEGRLARLARAELPAVLGLLRERGIAVVRAEVRERSGVPGHLPAGGETPASGEARVDGEGGVRYNGLGHGTVAKW